MGRAPFVGIHVRSDARRIGAAELVEAVVREHAAGRLPAGSRLPPVRVLEQQYGLSKNTAQVAYDELVARGVAVAREREGVFIAEPPAAARRGDDLRGDLRADVDDAAAPPLPQLRPPPVMGTGAPRGGLAMGNVFIDPDLLPAERLAECTRAVLRQPGLANIYDPQGYPPLRRAIAARLAARGIDVDADSIIVTTGSQQALDLVARSLEIRRVAIETPVYAYAKLLFESLGLQLTGLPLDPFAGLDLAAWDRALAAGRPGLLYAISSFHNPTGYSYTTGELMAVLELARRHQVAILEDDWGSDMLSGSEYRPMLRLLGGEHVLYVNSFTKKLLPSMRVGFLAAHPSLVPSLLAAKRLATLGNVWLSEAVVAEFLERGYYDGHLAALQQELDARYRACLAALDELMPPGVRWTRPGGGPTLWLEVPRTIDLDELERRLARREVWIDNRTAAFLGVPHLHGFRIGFAWLPSERLRGGLEIIADTLRALL
ncbi:MAG TPA: PLP-dependent aminotransferase family protein [Kofleriaceae bacterium]|nr:PLP-dependent aminotransferase family protein [Kofleriaceae bacterium]